MSNTPFLPTEFERLLCAAKNGCPLSLGTLLQGYRRYLLKIAKEKVPHKLKSKVGGSDVVEDAIVHAYQSMADFRGTTMAEFQRWLAIILMHAVTDCIKGFRCQSRDLSREVPIAEEWKASISSGKNKDEPLEKLLCDEEQTILNLAINTLPEQSQIIFQRFDQAHSAQQIAVELGISVDAVYKARMRAIQSMKDFVAFRYLKERHLSAHSNQKEKYL